MGGALAMLGPFGLIVLTMLSDKAPAPGDLYQRFVGKLKIYLRVAYELGFFLVVWVGAFLTMVLKRDLMIMSEAATTGISTAQIIDRQNASSGMWAFSEGLEACFWWFSSICCGRFVLTLIGRLPRLWAPPKSLEKVVAQIHNLSTASYSNYLSSLQSKIHNIL